MIPHLCLFYLWTCHSVICYLSPCKPGVSFICSLNWYSVPCEELAFIQAVLSKECFFPYLLWAPESRLQFSMRSTQQYLPGVPLAANNRKYDKKLLKHLDVGHIEQKVHSRQSDSVIPSEPRAFPSLLSTIISA